MFSMYKMTVLSETKSHSDGVDYFTELPFYNKPIEKPNVKQLKNIDRLAGLPFYEQLRVVKTYQAFRGYAVSYKVEIIERKCQIVQLKTSKMSIKDLFSNRLKKTKGLKHQIIVKVLLKKYKHTREIEFSPVYFNSLKKTVINDRLRLKRYFQELLYIIHDLINEVSGWIVESIESQYIYISTYRPLLGSFSMKLSPKKDKSKSKTKIKNIFYGVT